MAHIQNPDNFVAFLRRWVANNPGWAVDYSDRWNPRHRTAHEISTDILGAMESDNELLARWFQSPDGELIVWAAGQTLGPFAGADLDLFVDAVTLAAQARSRNQKVTAGALLCVAAFLGLVLLREVFA
jgi:hypothetical protein